MRECAPQIRLDAMMLDEESLGFFMSNGFHPVQIHAARAFAKSIVNMLYVGIFKTHNY